MREPIQVESLAEAKQHLQSHDDRLNTFEGVLRDHAQRFETLQTPMWKRAWFRVAQGWPGIRDLNAAAPAHRPAWLRRIVGR